MHSTQGLATPYFVEWTLALPCALRGGTAWQNAEATARHLRGLRCWGEALAARRIVSDFCFDSSPTTQGDSASPPRVFRQSQSLAPFGEAEFILETCAACPAHVAGTTVNSACARCFGALVLGDDIATIAQTLAALVAPRDTTSASEPPTHPVLAWFELWRESPLPTPCLVAWDKCRGKIALPNQSELNPFENAVALALSQSIPLCVTLYPRGQDTVRAWRLEPHCAACRAPWPEKGNCCLACGNAGRQGRTRRATRGERPWRPLDEVPGARAAFESWRQSHGK